MCSESSVERIINVVCIKNVMDLGTDDEYDPVITLSRCWCRV